MALPGSVVFSISCLLVTLMCQPSKSTYLNQIAVHIEGGSNIADKIATKHGYTNMGQVWFNKTDFGTKARPTDRGY
jgi:hypothetical protein